MDRGNNFHFVLQEEIGIGGSFSNNSQIQKDWSPKNFPSVGGNQVSTIDALKPMNQELFLDQQSLNSVATSTGIIYCLG
ncbi:hypothetical protein E2542_SST29619 [Spatholobus suberectus]|nr:hypothetical protein E2542_SST29619 [Spatholobus suberectus]